MSRLDVREGVPLSPLSTLGIGGPARYYARVSSDDEVRAAVDWARARELPLLVLGGGSNVVRVSCALRPAGPPAVVCAELARHLDESGAREPSLAEVREAVLALRRRKSMVLDPRDPDARSVGSFFMNPIVPAIVAADMEVALRRRGLLREGERPPQFPAGDGRVKLSAAWLIERAGLAKGYRRGNVGLSARHTLAIVNRGGAAATEVVALAREVRDRVRDAFGITLVPEPVFVNLSMD